jgi:hypothetical protein
LEPGRAFFAPAGGTKVKSAAATALALALFQSLTSIEYPGDPAILLPLLAVSRGLRAR